MHGSTRTLITALSALGLAATSVACSGGTDQAVGAEQPTFRRAEGSHIAFDEPISTTSDLLPPAAEDQPWTIVGSLLDPDRGAPVAAVWTSDDAKDWKREDIRPMRSGLGESMAAAVPTDHGILAVGRQGDGDHSDAVVWRQDGDDWKQIRPDAMGGDHEQWAFDVARGPGGFLVAGGENVWGEVRARLWFSADGETWESVDGGPSGPLDKTGEESVRDIASFGSGFVAVGSRRVEGEQDGIVWLSPDGKTWEEVDAPALGGAGRQDVTAVVDTGSGLVAGGFSAGDGPGVSVMWLSPDGRTWAPSPGSPLLPSSSARTATSDMAIRSLSVDASGILASGGDRWRPDVWRSVDSGASWLPVPSPVHGEVYKDGVRLDDAAAANGINAVAIGSGPTVMVLGERRWDDVTNDAFPRGGTQPFASAVAAGSKGTVAAGGLYSPPAAADARETFAGEVWLQGRGGDWDTVNVDALASGQVLDVVAYKGGFAAVGTEDFSVANKRDISGDNGPDGMVWISPDGKTWGRIGSTDARIDDAYLQYLDDPNPENAATIVALEADLPPESVAPAGGDGTRELSAVAPFLDGYIAVGTLFSGDDTDPIVLYSLDGTTLQGESPGVGGPGNQRLSDVCVGPDDTAVAVGVAGATGGHEAAVIWRNPADGVWSVGTAEDGSFGGPGNQVAYACAAGPEGFVIVGSDDGSGDTDARIWTSPDGKEWTQVEAGTLGGGGDQWASAVAAVPGGDDGDGWIVAGVDTEGGTRDIALWRLSADGDLTRRDQGETALGGPGDQTASSVSVDEDGHVTVAGTDYGRVGLWESDRLDR